MSLFKYLLLEECYLCLLWKTKALELSLGELHVILSPIFRKNSDFRQFYFYYLLFFVLDRIWTIVAIAWIP